MQGYMDVFDAIIVIIRVTEVSHGVFIIVILARVRYVWTIVLNSESI